jgi:hypothetical protein
MRRLSTISKTFLVELLISRFMNSMKIDAFSAPSKIRQRIYLLWVTLEITDNISSATGARVHRG